MVTIQEIEAAIGPLDSYAHQCHAAAFALVNSGILGESRVARGSCRGVGGQHSWAVLGMDCYDDNATIVDVTAWSYFDAPRLWIGKIRDLPHRPHGYGSIADSAKPHHMGGETVTITDKVRGRLSYGAAYLIRQLEPLDHRGWAQVANLPVGGWPAAEVLEAMDDSGLGPLIPVDRMGMLTNRNPGGLYLKEES